MFGTDSEVTEAMYRNYFRWLETTDEYFDYWGYPGQGRWKIYGLGLPDPVLEKIYHKNAEEGCWVSSKVQRRPKRELNDENASRFSA